MVERHEKPGDVPFKGGDACGGDDCQAGFFGAFGIHHGILDAFQRFENHFNGIRTERHFRQESRQGANPREDHIRWDLPVIAISSPNSSGIRFLLWLMQQGCFDGIDVCDRPRGNGQVLVDGGLRDSALLEHGSEFLGSAD